MASVRQHGIESIISVCDYVSLTEFCKNFLHTIRIFVFIMTVFVIIISKTQ